MIFWLTSTEIIKIVVSLLRMAVWKNPSKKKDEKKKKIADIITNLYQKDSGEFILNEKMCYLWNKYWQLTNFWTQISPIFWFKETGNKFFSQVEKLMVKESVSFIYFNFSWTPAFSADLSTSDLKYP